MKRRLIAAGAVAAAATATVLIALPSSSPPRFAPKAAAAPTVPVVLVHGYSFGTGCPGYVTPTYWAGVITAMRAAGWPAPATIDFYQCDSGGVSVGKFTRDTPIDTIAAALDAYLVQLGTPVILVGHSMGGLIIRSMLNGALPPVTVPQAATISTPFDGAAIATQPICGGTVECGEFTPGSAWLAGLRATAPGGTDWTTMGGGPCDVVTYASANDFPAAHRVAWGYPCYTHTGILTDTSAALNARVSWEDPGSSTVHTATGSEHSVAYLLEALTSGSW